MSTKFRTALLAVAFAATVAATITGATIRGETKETSLDGLCATAAWPMIPADCLEGSDGREVRLVGADIDAFYAEDEAEGEDLNIRFAAAFGDVL